MIKVVNDNIVVYNLGTIVPIDNLILGSEYILEIPTTTSTGKTC